jgi:subtilase family serine protease
VALTGNGNNHIKFHRLGQQRHPDDLCRGWLSQRPAQPSGVEIVLTQNGQLRVGTIGRTSVACPFFSAIWAIANQKAGHPLGLAAPSLYNLPINAFNDVRPYSSPTNVTGTDSSLTFGIGWDNVTGMGTPNGLAFIRAVAK